MQCGNGFIDVELEISIALRVICNVLCWFCWTCIRQKHVLMRMGQIQVQRKTRDEIKWLWIIWCHMWVDLWIMIRHFNIFNTFFNFLLIHFIALFFIFFTYFFFSCIFIHFILSQSYVLIPFYFYHFRSSYYHIAFIILFSFLSFH